jgi:hypothetical protein
MESNLTNSGFSFILNLSSLPQAFITKIVKKGKVLYEKQDRFD